MRVLLLVRHGKSDWGSGVDGDFNRPLAERGRRDAPMMGRLLAKAGLIPDLILSSPAVRAAETTRLMAEAMEGKGSPRVDYVDDFYGCSVSEYVAGIRRVDAGVGVLMLVGHNPTMGEAVSEFASAGRMSLDFPTCAVACLDVMAGDWAVFTAGGCSLRFLVVPKLLKHCVVREG